MPNFNIIEGEPYPLGVDASAHVDPQALQRSPYCAIVRYLTPGGIELPQKLLTFGEARGYIEADIALISVWESNGKAGNGWSTGWNDATMAMSNHLAAGGPTGSTLYFAIDYDAPEGDQPLIDDYIKGVYDAVGKMFTVGLYAGYWVCMRARQTFPDLRIWQTEAWSGPNVLDNIQMLQRIGQPTVGGVTVDVNEIRDIERLGYWQKANEMATNELITSGIDGKQYSESDMLSFIDYHTFNTAVNILPGLQTALSDITNQLTAIQQKLGIK